MIFFHFQTSSAIITTKQIIASNQDQKMFRIIVFYTTHHSFRKMELVPSLIINLFLNIHTIQQIHQLLVLMLQQ